MKIINTIANLRQSLLELRHNNQPIALVPTMGALHDGHMALVKTAQEITKNVVVSIFVNPTQFGEGEDLESYPRQLKDDANKLQNMDIPIIWAPEPKTVYPEGFATNMQINGLDKGLCGAKRPGHFDGVILIVAKLFNQTGADYAFFGEKDYQQLAIIKQMSRDLDFDIEIIGVPTVRNKEGLALSSRNAYLSDDEKDMALALPRALQKAAHAIQSGHNVPEILNEAQQNLKNSGFKSVDYFDLVDSKSLKILDIWDGQEARLLAAAYMGRTRLIDNFPVKPL